MVSHYLNGFIKFTQEAKVEVKKAKNVATAIEATKEKDEQEAKVAKEAIDKAKKDTKVAKEAIDKAEKEAKAVKMAMKKAEEVASKAKASHEAKMVEIKKLMAVLEESKTNTVEKRKRMEAKSSIEDWVKASYCFKGHGSVLSLKGAS